LGVTDVSVTVRVRTFPAVSCVYEVVRLGSVIRVGRRKVGWQTVLIHKGFELG
jgi:hypothetical protein